MITPLGDHESIDRLARTYDSVATAVEQAAARTGTTLENADFQAPRADLLRTIAADRGRQCSGHAEELRELALALRRHATWIRDTTDEMKKTENRIRAWATANPAPPDGVSMGPDASLIKSWPETGSLEWKELAAKLRNKQVVF